MTSFSPNAESGHSGVASQYLFTPNIPVVTQGDRSPTAGKSRSPRDPELGGLPPRPTVTVIRQGRHRPGGKYPNVDCLLCLACFAVCFCSWCPALMSMSASKESQAAAMRGDLDGAVDAYDDAKRLLQKSCMIGLIFWGLIAVGIWALIHFRFNDLQ